MLKGTLAITTIAVGMVAYAQNPSIAGDYTGMLGPYHVKLHLVAGPDGKLSGTAANVDMGTLAPCENIRGEGQTLSFSVPMVSGTWTGFVSADSNSLSGMWSQGGNPVQLNFTRSSGASQNAAAFAPTSAPSQGEVTWDDYVFKFLSGGNIVQAYQSGKLVGMIVTTNGQQQVRAVPGTDSAKLQKSYQDYQTFNARGHGAASPTTTTPVASGLPSPTPAAPVTPNAAIISAPPSLGFANDGKADPTGIKFEGKAVTVPRTDGMVVTFSGEDVTIGGARGPMYVLRHKKASVGRAFEQAMDHSHATGGGVAGGGIEFLRAGGGLIYDSGMGGYNVQEAPGARTAKQLSLVAVDAVEAVRQVPGHSDFKPSGYNGLKEVSQYRLRSDGSR